MRGLGLWQGGREGAARGRGRSEEGEEPEIKVWGGAARTDGRGGAGGRKEEENPK